MGIDAERRMYLVLAGVWSALALAALRLERGPTVDYTPVAPGAPGRAGGRARAVVLVVASAVVLGLSATGVKAVDAAYEDANRLFFKLVRGMRGPRGAGGGFSNQAELGSVIDVQGAQGDDVALRAWGPVAPATCGRRSSSATRAAAGRPRAPRPRRRAALDPRRQDARPRPPAGQPRGAAPHRAARVALRAAPVPPLQAAEVGGLGDEVVTWPGGVLTAYGFSTARGYEVQTDPTPALPGGDEEDWLALPADAALLAALDATLHAAGLAPVSSAGIGGPRPAPVPAAAAAGHEERLARHVLSRWRYHVGIEFEPGSDPLVQFLTTKGEGHCELFAAAGTLLLRRLGVPARYVTGFVVDERSPWGDMWLARGRHAHAWIEAWAPVAGWHTVELTPASGVPAAASATGTQALREWLEAQLARVTGLVRRVDFFGLVVLFGQAVVALFAWLVGAWWRVVLLLAAAGLVGWRAWRRRLARRAPRRALPPALLREQAEIAALERALGRRGLSRPPAQTLLAWADRVEAAAPELAPEAGRIRAYAARRFAPVHSGA
jgi:transglutaminase-like putative cysteine protease